MEHSIDLKELNTLDLTYKMSCTFALELFPVYSEFENR